MQSVMNLKIKYRESFRPFAPSVLRDRMPDYFDLDSDSPYMLLVAPVLTRRRLPTTADQDGLWGIERLNVPRSDIPAVTHLDYSARVQSVDEETNPRYFRLLKAFEARTGCGVIVNTSFNVRNEPIVCSPEDAYRCFMRSAIDLLVMENCVVYKADQHAQERDTNWQKEFELD
jgi:carbamoyltransferase